MVKLQVVEVCNADVDNPGENLLIVDGSTAVLCSILLRRKAAAFGLQVGIVHITHE